MSYHIISSYSHPFTYLVTSMNYLLSVSFISSQSHPFIYPVTYSLCFFSSSSISSHSLSPLLILSRSHSYSYIKSVLCSFRLSSKSISSHSLSSLLIPSQPHPYLYLVTSFLCFISCLISLLSLSHLYVSLVNRIPTCIL